MAAVLRHFESLHRDRRRRLCVPLSPRSWVSTAPRSTADGSRRLAMAYHIPAFDHADALPLEVLGQILSQGQSSRLYRDLVYERQLATSISANADLRIDPGLFTIVSMVQAGKRRRRLRRRSTNRSSR